VSQDETLNGTWLSGYKPDVLARILAKQNAAGFNLK
jgi:hypothetical protein